MTESETQTFIEKWVVAPFTLLMGDVKDEIKTLRERTQKLDSTISSLETIFGVLDAKIHQTKEDVDDMRNKIDDILKIQVEQAKQVIIIQEQMKVMVNNSCLFDKKIDELSKTINTEMKATNNSFMNAIRSKEFWIMLAITELLFSGQFAIATHFLKV